MRPSLSISAAAMLLAVSGQAFASFHFMQVEQAIGGVAGDDTQQAIQLRMRSGFQNQVQLGSLVVRDAAGLNPVVVVDFTSAVPNSSAGDRVLIASPAFAALQGLAPDFLMTSLIPPGYLAGGQLSFESDQPVTTQYWLLCWGSYIGPSIGSTTNDADGVFAPCEPGSLPSTGLNALLFGGAASAMSTNNAADYASTSGPAVFTNNARASATVVEPPLFANGFED